MYFKNPDVLIVAEKNTVARAIARYLTQSKVYVRKIFGIETYWFIRNYRTHVSIGLKGHILDFDFEEKYNNWHDVEPSKLFNIEPIFVIRDEVIKYVKALKYLGKLCNEVILALDSDSEGEAIAYEVMLVIRSVNPYARFKRALFSAITKRDIEYAFSHLTNPRPLIAKKVFTRMKLDLMLGAVFTRLLTLGVEKCLGNLNGKFLSYGPCQTPVLNLVVQRALERENFKPEKYYILKIQVNVNDQIITFTGNKVFKNLSELRIAIEKLRNIKYVEIYPKYVKVKVLPPKPLDTIEFERRVSKFLNIRSKKALTIAEELYRRGYISYPRTETNIYPSTLNLREVLTELLNTEHCKYVERLLNKKVLTPTRGNSFDEAHPPIYPIQGVKKIELLKEFRNRVEFWRIYDYIVRHFLATLSDSAIIEKQYLKFNIYGIEFSATGLRILNLGFWEIYPYTKPSEKILPYIKPGTIGRIAKIIPEERETEPPPYLTEAELLKLMKKYGIGTDATMQDHIYTNIVRGYFRIRKRSCIPTELGRTLIKVLQKYTPSLIDPLFRSRMEKDLQNIAKGLANPDHVIEQFKKESIKYYIILRNKIHEIGKELANALVKTFKKLK